MPSIMFPITVFLLRNVWKDYTFGSLSMMFFASVLSTSCLNSRHPHTVYPLSICLCFNLRFYSPDLVCLLQKVKTQDGTETELRRHKTLLTIFQVIASFFSIKTHFSTPMASFLRGLRKLEDSVQPLAGRFQATLLTLRGRQRAHEIV